MRTIAALTLLVSLAPACYAENWISVHAEAVDAVRRADFDTAGPLFLRSLALAHTTREIAISQNDIGVSLHRRGREAEAKDWLVKSLASWSILTAEPTGYARTAAALAAVERNLGDYSAAEGLLRKATELRDVEGNARADLLSSLADMMREKGHFDEARALLREAALTPGIGLRQQYDSRQGLAQLDRDAQNWESSAAEWEEALALADKMNDANARADCHRGLGQTWLDRGNPARAEPLLKKALAELDHATVRDETEIANILASLGELYLTEDKTSLAEDALSRAMAGEERTLGPAHPQIALLLELLAGAASRENHPDAARAYMDRAQEIMQSHFGPQSPMLAGIYANRGMLEQKFNNPAAAMEMYRRALDNLGSAGGVAVPLRVRVLIQYAQLLKSAHRNREAEAVLAQAKSFR